MRLATPLLILAVSIGGAAADPTDPQAKRRAASAFAAAERAFADEDYPEALRLFRAAFDAAPNDAVRFNIAVCLERLGRFREAGLEYDAAVASTLLTTEIRDRAREESRRVRARLGRVEITGTPPGAVVRIDGVELCRLPCALDVDPGRRELTARAGAALDREIVEVVRGETHRIALAATITAAPRGPGILTWAGAGTTALGSGAAIIFGLRARALHDDYLANPMTETRDDGLRMRDLTNTSIAIAAVGLAVVAFDLVVLARRPGAVSRRDRPRTALLELRF